MINLKFIIGACLVVIVGGVLFFQKEMNSLKSDLSQARLRNQLDQEYIDFLYNKDVLQNISSGLQIDHDMTIDYGDSSGLKLQDFTLNRFKDAIFVRIKDEHCKSCYDLYFDYLKEFQQSAERQILVLASFPSNRAYLLFKDSQIPNIESLRLSNDLDLPIESFKAPYIFTLNSVGEIGSLYAVDRSNIHQVSTVLNELGKDNE